MGTSTSEQGGRDREEETEQQDDLTRLLPADVLRRLPAPRARRLPVRVRGVA
jgi:hypothetical protein